MKKLFLILSLLIIGTMVNAQSIYNYTFTADTLTNGDTAYCTSAILHSAWSYNFVISADELSGSATLVSAVEVSNDNSVWAVDSTSSNYTLTADGVYSYFGTAYGRYVRVRVIQTGTATTSIFGTLTIKR